jgi:putative Mn2+ efflux pump MntP
MSLLSLVLLSLGLAMDATAVAAARGLSAKEVRVRDGLRVALLFGGFQAGMPVIGWAIGAAFASRVLGWGHWITFVVLGGIGFKMLYETRSSRPDEEAASPDEGGPFGLRVLVLLAIATSIDALAAGVTLAVSDVSIVLACGIIGAVTAALSLLGVHLGHRFGARLGKRLEVLGGLVLVGLAIKAMVEHFAGR